jgi:hypothetical protein
MTRYHSQCGYHTDREIVACPICKLPVLKDEDWGRAARIFDPSYHKFLLQQPERCFRSVGGPVVAWQRRFNRTA